MTITIDPYTTDEVIEKARGITSGQLLVVDFSDQRWVMAMALMIEGIKGNYDLDDIGIFLVPFAEHAPFLWQGNVPGLVLKCEVVPKVSVDALQVAIDVLLSDLTNERVQERLDYLDYAKACDEENLEAFPFDRWIVNDKPKGPLG